MPFLMVKRPVNQTQKGTSGGVGVHMEDKHSGGGRDRRRCGEVTRQSEKCVAQPSVFAWVRGVERT